MKKLLCAFLVLLTLAACGKKAAPADANKASDGKSGGKKQRVSKGTPSGTEGAEGGDSEEPTVLMEGDTASEPGAAKQEETLSVEAQAPTIVPLHGGGLFAAGSVLLELVLTADDQRIYLMDTRGQPAQLPPDCLRFSFLADTGDVADFRRAKEDYFVTKELPGAAAEGLTGRLYFAQCPIEGVLSAQVQISPDLKRLASHGGKIFYVSGISAELVRDEAKLKIWLKGRDPHGGKPVPIKTVSLQSAAGEFLKIVPVKGQPSGEAAYELEIPEGLTGGKLEVGTGTEKIEIEVEW